MGSIAGPIISFRFNAPSAQQAAKQLSDVVGNTMKQAGKSSAQQFVSDWQAAAAKLRAQLSSEKLGLNQIAQARERIVALAQREMAVLQKKQALTRQDLSAMKSATMEIERQKNALEGFGAVTSPTRKIVQQMISGIGLRAGSYGGSFGSFAGLRINESLGKLADEATGGRLALLGVGAAAVVVAAAMVDMARKGAEMAVSIRNASEATGISIKSMVELQSASRVLGIDSDVTVKMFKKFNQELTYAMGASVPHATIEAKRAAEVFQLLGVNVKKAAADPMEGFRELSEGLKRLPDGAIKSATEVMLLGRGGQEAAPLIQHLSEAILATKDSADSLASKIGGAAKAGDALSAATTNLSNKWHELEMNIATVFVPLLAGTIGLLNRPFDVAKFLPPTGLRTQYDIHGKPISAPEAVTGSAADALLAAAAGGVNLGKNPGQAQPVDVLNKLAQAFANESTASGKAAKAHKKLGESLAELMRHYEEARRVLSKENAANFAQLLFQIYMGGQAGADFAPDKTGAGVNDLMRSIAQEAVDAAQKIRDANVKAAQDIVDAWRSWRDEGKNLFETLLSGGRNFAQQLVRDMENIALKPVQNAFGNLIGNILYQLDKMVPNSAPTGKGGKTGGGIFGKIWQGIQKGIQPPKSIQQAMETIQNAQITAKNVYINGVPLGVQTPLPKPSSFLGMDFLGGMNNASLTSLAGIGGFSMALAAAGGTAIAGSGGAAVAGGGGMAVAGGGSAGTVSSAANTAGAIMQKGGGTLGAIGSMIPGLAMLGLGIGTRNGVATAIGAGMTVGSGLTALSNTKSLQGTGLGNAFGKLGAAAPGIGLMFAGNQAGGLGGAAMGALGGLQAGLELGGPIGGAVGAIAGALMGAFGHKNNQKAWQDNVTRAMNNQRVTLPPSETFSFASGNNMASIFSTTFGQGPGGFSNSTLAANTPFFANAIYGTPRNTNAQIAWNALMNGLNPNSPFFGGTPNPFAGGGLPSGLRYASGLPSGAYSPNSFAGYAAPQGGVQVHFTVPGYVDKAGLADIVSSAAPLIHSTVAQSVYRQSTGMRRAISRSINLP